MLALKKLILANHALTDKFNTQILHLWVKVKREVTDFLSPEHDLEGFRNFSDVPPTMVIERAIDIVGARIHADALAASRKKMDATKKLLADDLKSKAKAGWRTV